MIYLFKIVISIAMLVYKRVPYLAGGFKDGF